METASGRLLWQRSLGDIATGAGVDTHESTGYTSATPVFDGRRVFTLFGSGFVVAHDADGNRLWAGVVREPEKGPEHGPSPLRSGDAFRASDGSSLAAGLDSLEYATPIADDGVVYFVEKRATAALLPDSKSSTSVDPGSLK